MKKLNRILMILCLLAALFCIVSISVFASELVLDEIYIDYEPYPSENDSWQTYKPTVSGNGESLYANIGKSASRHTENFVPGEHYNISISIKPANGYTFSEDIKVYINGVLSDIKVNAVGYISYRYDIMVGEPIHLIEFPAWFEDVQVGTPGTQEIELPTPEGANYSLTAMWYVYGSAGSPTILQDGKIYRLLYTAKPISGYYFADDATVTQAGEPVSQFKQNNKNIRQLEQIVSINVEYVDAVDITYTRPRLGDLRSAFTFNNDGAAKMSCFISVEGDSPTQHLTFEEGIRYIASGDLKANIGYAFAPQVTLTFNGEDPRVVTPTDLLTLPVQQHQIQLARPVETVEFPAWPETVSPGAGGTSELSVPEGAGYTLQQQWLDLRTGTVVDSLKAGEVYTLMYLAEAAPGYIFADSTAATVGAENCVFHRDGNTILTYRSYDLGAQKIDRIDLTLPKLYKGCTPGTVTVPKDAPYTVMETIWAESTTGAFADALPIDGPSFHTSVFAIPVLVAKEGYTFSENVKLYFNGIEVTIEDILLEGPIAELAGLCGTLTPPTDTGWYQEDNTWAYYVNGIKKKNSWMKDSKGWCYLGAAGLMLKEDWAKDSKGWCYVGSDGYMVYDKWVLWNDGWYYIAKSGYMLSNAWKKDYKDWCYLGASGKMLTDAWQKDSKGWCYLGADGYMVRNGWAADSSGICRLGSDGYIVYNRWIQESDGWRYVDGSGYVVIGNWAYVDGYWYAFDEYALMYSNTTVTYNGKYYHLDANGRMLTNAWFKIGRYWSYAGADGAVPLNTWVKDSTGWCYIGSEGVMLTSSWISENGKSYYVDSSGYMLRNTTRTFYYSYSIPVTYIFDSNGVATRQQWF